MAKIEWNKAGERFYEAGVDNAVFFANDGKVYPWNGLISVTRKALLSKADSLYFDGQQYWNGVNVGEFAGTIRAYTAPESFFDHVGQTTLDGLTFLSQPAVPFRLAYRTGVGDDINGQYSHYKLHLIYNVLVVDSDTEYGTITDDPEAIELSWDISAMSDPSQTGGVVYPTAYVEIDSRKVSPQLLSYIEMRLYGGTGIEPTLPEIGELIQLSKNWHDVDAPLVNFKGKLSVSGYLPHDAAEGDAYVIEDDVWVKVNGIWVNKGPINVT